MQAEKTLGYQFPPERNYSLWELIGNLQKYWNIGFPHFLNMKYIKFTSGGKGRAEVYLYLIPTIMPLLNRRKFDKIVE